MELKKLELPSGAFAYLKPELTAGEYDDVQMIFFENFNFDVGLDGKLKQDIKFNPSMMLKAKYKLLSVSVARVEKDGKATAPVSEEFLKGMSKDDIEFLSKAADKMYAVSTLDSEAKKK